MVDKGKIVMIKGEPHCDCGLLGKMIYDGLCYDIQMVRKSDKITDENLKEYLMMEDANIEMMVRANDICPACTFNQLTE